MRTTMLATPGPATSGPATPRLPLLALAMLAVAGCGSSSINTRNNEPVATIVYPQADTELTEGYTTPLRGSVTDTNHAAADLVATWKAGREVLCAEAPIAEDGSTSCDVGFEVGDAAITLLARDPDGAEGEATVEVAVWPNEGPSVQILAPDPTGTFSSDSYVVFEAVASDGEDGPQELSAVWTDGDGTVLAIDNTFDADGSLAGALLLEPGEHAISLTVTDLLGQVAVTSVPVVVEEGGG